MTEREIAEKRIRDYLEFLRRYAKDLTPEEIDRMLDVINGDRETLKK